MQDLIKERIRHASSREKVVSAEEAAGFVRDGTRIATSGTTASGYPLSFFKALVRRAEEKSDIKIDLWSAAPLGPEVDGKLPEVGILNRRLCHQANPVMAKAINRGEVLYSDMGPYVFPNQIRYGFFDQLDLTIIEAIALTEEGNIVPSTCIADSPTLIRAANKVIVEINTNLPLEMAGMHDIVIPDNPPNRYPIGITTPRDRVGTPYIPVDPNKIIGIVISSEPNRVSPREEISEESSKIAQHLISFFETEVALGRLPKNLLPLQTGLGSLGGAFLIELGKSGFTKLQTFSALLNDAILDLIDIGKIDIASGSGLYFSSEGLDKFYGDIEKYRRFIILRPVDISTYPELIQRLGVLAFNGAVEIDIYGHVNSSHVSGGRILTGVAGSIEYARNGYLSIFMTPSIGKGGHISRIVPMVTHVDHTEHDVHIVVTEQGLADLRGLDPRERAREIVNKCAHPDYKAPLMDYFERACSAVNGHEPQLLEEAFSFHRRLTENGSMKG